MHGDTIYLVAMLVIGGLVVALMIWYSMKKKQYMKKQLETGEDKKMVLDLMAQVMGDLYGDFTYLVGYYTKTTHSGNTTTYYYFPYVLAFNATDVIVFAIIKKEGKLYIRNRLPIDWNNTKLYFSTKKGGMRVEFTVVGEKMPINIDYVIQSGGVEESDRPLGVYQEKELEQLKAYLPQYSEYAKIK